MWPHGLEFPRESKVRKGIAAIPKDSARILLAALRDTENPLTFEKVKDKDRKRLVSSQIPFIIGAPPPHGSNDLHGRRYFADGTVDHNRLKRLENVTSDEEDSDAESSSTGHVTITALTRNRDSSDARNSNVVHERSPEVADYNNYKTNHASQQRPKTRDSSQK
ncbi:hypothetical protein DXG01_012825 [Tephrocybe rancida]|nr:hypothetical protein DXG01_012825 [Tephrocybe rancida]